MALSQNDTMAKLILHLVVAGVLIAVCVVLDVGVAITVVSVLAGAVLVHFVWDRFVFNPYAYLGAMPVASDDPIMQKAIERAKQTLSEFWTMYPEHREDSMVKFRFTTDTGETENLWGDLLEVDTDAGTARVYVRTLPVSQTGEMESTQTVPFDQIVDWQVEMRDGSLRGGFTNLALFKIYERQEGHMHPAFLDQLGRFQDAI